MNSYYNIIAQKNSRPRTSQANDTTMEKNNRKVLYLPTAVSI